MAKKNKHEWKVGDKLANGSVIIAITNSMPQSNHYFDASGKYINSTPLIISTDAKETNIHP
jgi:hypothetical protein